MFRLQDMASSTHPHIELLLLTTHRTQVSSSDRACTTSIISSMVALKWRRLCSCVLGWPFWYVMKVSRWWDVGGTVPQKRRRDEAVHVCMSTHSLANPKD